MHLWKKRPMPTKINNCKMRAAFLLIYLSVLLIIIILPPSTIADDWSASCASNCTCKWTNGKKSAICSSLDLSTIPTTLSTEIQVLVLNDNHIAYLNREEFITLGLLNLQRIYMKKSDVQFINKETFKNLKILVEIDLSDNKIELLDKDTFVGNDRLRILYLNGNPLKKLMAYQFPILPHLRTLDLHDCLINYIDPLAFANLNLLEFLYLKNNLLENLSEYVFQHMNNLKTLVLDENPWQCNCKLRNFRSWYIKSKLNSISLICKGPFHHKGKHWENIDELYFGCQPKVDIFSNEDVQNIDIGTNTTFSCLIYGDPLPDITWELNGKSFDNDNILFDQEMVASDKLWSNLTVFNMTSLDAGTYSCAAQNLVGIASQNISIYLSEIVQHVLVKTPETFWYFGLIMGTFGTVFLLILFSFVVCLCKRQTRRRRHPSKNIKGSVSFNDQEKKLLDLSITTTNDRGDSCGIDNNTPSSNKTESVIGFEPIEIIVENRVGGGGHGHAHTHAHTHGGGHGGGGSGSSNGGGVGGTSGGRSDISGNCMVNVSGNSMKCSGQGINNNNGGPNSMVSIANQQGPSCSSMISATIPEEFPLNVGVFPPPPEFCSNVVPNPAYGNIFISVSVTQDMLDSSDINIYPDLLNIPTKRVDTGTIVPMNVSSFATLPRNQRRGILKKDTNLYPHDEIVSYHNLDTSYCQPHHHIHEQQQQQQQQQQHQLQHHQTNRTSANNSSSSGGGGGGGGNSGTSTGIVMPHSTKSSATTCINCMKAQPHPYIKEDINCNNNNNNNNSNSNNNNNSNVSAVSTPPPPTQALLAGAAGGVVSSCGLPSNQCSRQSSIVVQTPPTCLNYDNMGRRITASGNSTLSLPDEERMENERIFNETNPLRAFNQHSKQKLPPSQQQQQQLQSKQQQTSSTATQSTQSDCLQSGNDFVSL